nr:3395_t:CDS:2 [Entrophospora candida]
MKCKNCQLDKLSREFPSDTISYKCQHAPSFCLKCLVNHLNDGHRPKQCPECKNSLNQKEIEILNFSWDKASFKINIDNISAPNVINNKKQPNTSSINLTGNFYVVMLDGHKIQLKLEKIKTVIALKQAISSEIKIEANKQKLIYNEVVLEAYHPNHVEKKLSDYNIVEGSHVQLIVLLYSISKDQSLNNLTFDLFWGFPGGLCDYLDGTCMLYNDKIFNRTFDYVSRIHVDLKDMSHSGDVMDAHNQRGHHRITVNLSSLPISVTKLYFILSSWNSPNIGSFPNPSFKLYDPDKPNEQLCKYEIRTAASSQAVIMCVVAKSKIDSTWNIYEIGKLSSGNAKNYSSIQATIGATQICINAATLALIDAGIPMSDYVCACSAGCIEDEPILDLNNIEESCNTPELSVALLPKSGKVALLQMESHLHVDKFELVMEQAAVGCKDVYNALNQEVIPTIPLDFVINESPREFAINNRKMPDIILANPVRVLFKLLKEQLKKDLPKDLKIILHFLRNKETLPGWLKLKEKFGFNFGDQKKDQEKSWIKNTLYTLTEFHLRQFNRISKSTFVTKREVLERQETKYQENSKKGLNQNNQGKILLRKESENRFDGK